MPTPTTISRSFSDFRGDYLTARDFGCAVDGATDDTAPFQSAVNECASLGTPLVIPGDAALVCSSLALPSNLTLMSRGAATIRMRAGSAANNSPWITAVSGASNIAFGGITFDGNYANQGTAAATFWAPDTVYPTNAKVIDAAGHVQKATTGGTSGPSYPTFNDAGGTATDNTVTWTDQGTTGVVSGAHLIQLVNASNIRFSNCNFQNSTGRCITGYSIANLVVDGGAFAVWQPGNVGAIHLEAYEGGAITGVRLSRLRIDCGTASSGIKLGGEIPCVAAGIAWTRPIRQIAASDITILNPAPDGLGFEIWTDTPATVSIPAGAFSDFQLDRISVFGLGGVLSGTGISLAGCGGSRGSLTNLLVDGCYTGIELMTSQATLDGAVVLGAGVPVSIDGTACSISQLSLLNVVVDASAMAASSASRAISVYVSNYAPLGVTSNTVEDILIGPGCQVLNLPDSAWGIGIESNTAGTGGNTAYIKRARVMGVKVIGSGGATANVGIAAVNNSSSHGSVDGTTVSLCELNGPMGYGISTSNATNSNLLLNRYDSGVAAPTSVAAGDIVVPIPGAIPIPLVGGGATGSGYVLSLENTSLANLVQLAVIWLGGGWPMVSMVDGSGNPLLQFRFDSGFYSYINSARLGVNTATPAYTLDVNGAARVVAAFACNGEPPQTAYPSGGAAPSTGSTQTTPYGYTTSAQADGIVTLLNKIRAALVANGIMS